jgi:hypothetical protein
MTGLAALPPRAIAQTWMPKDSAGTVLVSRRVVRVVFPPESKASWEWPERHGIGDAPTFFWYATFHGIEGRVRLGVTLDARDSVRVGPSLESVVRAAKVERCHLSRWLPCTERGVTAAVRDRRVAKPVSVRFDDPGRYKIIAVLGSRADTLNVEVRPAAPAP